MKVNIYYILGKEFLSLYIIGKIIKKNCLNIIDFNFYLLKLKLNKLYCYKKIIEKGL